MSNGKPIKEILPEVIRKLIIQRKHYLKQQRINRSKKNRDPNQPKLPGMKQGGNVAKKNKRKMGEYESPYHGRWSVSKETYEEAKKDEARIISYALGNLYKDDDINFNYLNHINIYKLFLFSIIFSIII